MKIRYAVLMAAVAMAQEVSHEKAEDNGTRGVLPADVVQARPGKPATASAVKPVYRLTNQQAAATLRQSPGTRQIGVTIWRLRPSTPQRNIFMLSVRSSAATVCIA